MPDKLITETRMKGALRPRMNSTPGFLHPSLSIWLQGRRQGCFPLRSHVLAVVVLPLSRSRKPEAQFVSDSQALDTPGRRSWGLGAFLEGSFPLSCVLGTLAQEKIRIWGLSCKFSFLIKLTVSSACGDPRAGPRCRWGSRCGICCWAREGKLEVGSWTSLD